MLWNGAISAPRLTSATWIAASSAGAWAASASPPFLSGPGAQMNSTRAPTRRHARAGDSGAIAAARPASSRAPGAPYGVVLLGHHLFQRRAHRGELQRIGRQRRAHAGIARFLRVDCRRGSGPRRRRSCPRRWPARRRRSACRARTGRAPGRAFRCSRRDRSRSCASRRSAAACPSARVSRRSASWKPGSGSTMQELVSTGSVMTQATSLSGERLLKRGKVVEFDDLRAPGSGRGIRRPVLAG